MSAPDTAMILAAGFGTRMGSLTQGLPKPMLPVAGRPMIDHALDFAHEAGVTRAVVNLHYLGDKIRSHLSERTRPEVVFSDEQPEILDTGGGVVHALPLLGAGPFHVFNSDSIFAGPNPMQVLAQGWRPTDMDALLLLVPRERTHAYTRPGDFFLPGSQGPPGRRGAAPAAPFVYTGAQILAPSALTDAPAGAFSMNLIWDELLAMGRLHAAVYPGEWVDVGTAEGLAAADRVLTSHRA